MHKDYRKQGIAQKLLKASINKLKELGCEYITTFVNENNTASTKFYLKNKFNKGNAFLWLDYILSEEFAR